METEKPFSERESLLLINSMINKAKNQFNENGHLYLLWGWVVFVCSIAQFVLLEIVHTGSHSQIWSLTWAAAIYQIIYLRRRKKRSRVRTYTQGILGSVWLSFAVTMLLIAFCIGSVKGIEFYQVIYPVFLALYGIPTFISGTILRFRPLMAGSISCWMLAAIAAFVPYQYHLLLLGVAVVVAWIIPGYLLQRKFKQENYL